MYIYIFKYLYYIPVEFGTEVEAAAWNLKNVATSRSYVNYDIIKRHFGMPLGL